LLVFLGDDRLDERASLGSTKVLWPRKAARKRSTDLKKAPWAPFFLSFNFLVFLLGYFFWVLEQECFEKLLDG